MTLRVAVVEAIDAEPGPVDCAEVARKVASSISDPRAALAEILPTYVRECIVTARLNNSPGTGQMPSDAQRSVARPGGTTPNRSRKVAAIREAWRARLDDRYATERGYVRLGDMTRDEVDTLARTLRDLEAAHAVKAARTEKLSAAMREYGADVPADLPDAVLADLFGGDER